MLDLRATYPEIGSGRGVRGNIILPIPLRQCPSDASLRRGSQTKPREPRPSGEAGDDTGIDPQLASVHHRQAALLGQVGEFGQG